MSNYVSLELTVWQFLVLHLGKLRLRKRSGLGFVCLLSHLEKRTAIGRTPGSHRGRITKSGWLALTES